MKRRVLFLLVFAEFQLFAATVSDVTARQRWPWNGLVDIDYTITGEVVENTAIAVRVKDLDTGRVYTPTNFLSALPTSEGLHRITWSTTADDLNLIASNVVVTVSLYDTTVVTNNLYYVIDLSGGIWADRFPVTCLSEVPKGGWSDEYKTTKLVLRRIEPGTISGIKTCESDEFTSIRIDKPYYIGVFEVTSAQFMLITGGIGVSKSALTNDSRPQTCVSYDRICGTGSWTPDPVESTFEKSSVLETLQIKTKLYTLNLPTEKQWEYACRAGTTSYYCTGDDRTDFQLEKVSGMDTVGRWLCNQNDGKGGFSGGVTTVGSYLPNAWGLYDMHGNAEEWCLEWYNEKEETRVARGGSCYYYARICRSGARNYHSSGSLGEPQGFRLCCAAEL